MIQQVISSMNKNKIANNVDLFIGEDKNNPLICCRH